VWDTDSGGATTAEEGFAASARQRLRTLTAEPDGEFAGGDPGMWWPIAPGAVRAADRFWGKSAVHFVATALLREAGPIGAEHRRPIASWAPEYYW
jgi:hypothetical protein